MNTAEPALDSLSPATAAALDARLDSLRAATAALAPPAALETRLLKAFATRRAWWRRPLDAFAPGGGLDLRRYGIPAIALAASLGMAGWTVLTPLLHLSRTNAETESAQSAALPASDGDAPFIALQPLDQIALEPQASVVSTTFPRSWLAGVGLPVDPERAAEPVQADMLVGANGQPLAVRISN